MKPTIFIACSSESLDLAYKVQAELEFVAEVTLWPQNVFKPGEYTIEGLTRQLHNCDFGVFLLTPDDMGSIRGKRAVLPRDNVILELGMFLGRLGRERCFMVIPRGHSSMRKPSDLAGIEMLTYDAQRTDGNLRAAVGPACDRMREVINERGPIRLPTGFQTTDGTQSTTFAREDRDRLEAKINQIAQGIAKNGESGSILFVDFDRFASLNRWYGIEVCDEVITVVEELISKKFGDEYWQRVGGDQYLICCRSVTGAQAMRAASSLVQEAKGYDWSVLSPNLYVTISVGVAEFKKGRTVDDWIVRAIHGSINAKKNGGCRASRGPFEVPKHLRVAYELSLS